MAKIHIINGEFGQSLNLQMAPAIKAGFPSPAQDYAHESLDFNRDLIRHPEATFYGRVDGDSMIDANIYSGDIVIVDKSQRNPSPSQVAVCQLNGDYTLKCFEVRNGVGWLIPANPDYPEIKVTEDDSFYIWGTVTYVIHKPNNR